jgi:hypothetical protein
MGNGHAIRSLLLAALVPLLLTSSARSAGAEDRQLDRGLEALQRMAGCYLVDYSYVETEALKPGYVRDGRVYDVNRDKSVKEWIYPETVSPRRVRLQRILFATDAAGAVIAGSEIRHQTEDWEYGAAFLYDFVAPLTWHIRDLRSTPALWTRRVTNLDDGLRYQCPARWTADTAYPEWTCSNHAPIPGRETRDMGRADYHALERTTRIIAYGTSWLERQDNVKTIHQDGERVPLARETGKNWYVRLPDAECVTARAFARPRQAFWALSRETWDGVLTGRAPFIETVPPGQPPRFVKMHQVEQDLLGRDLADAAQRQAARERILAVIREYRAP